MATSTRRGFLRGAAGLGTATLVPRIGWAAAGGPRYLAAAGLPDQSYWLLGLTEAGAETFRLRLPDRGHAAAAHPSRPEAVAFARRPGTFALVIDCAEGARWRGCTRPRTGTSTGTAPSPRTGGCSSPPRTRSPTAPAGSASGTRADGYRRIGEVWSGGDGPHEVRLMPDGRRFAVANGGIETDPTSGRSALNLATMRSNLAYLDVASGEVVQTLALDEGLRLNSIRHIAAGRDGTLAAGLQWQGSDLEHPPLLAVHRPGTDRLALYAAEPAVQRRMRNYAGSVAVSDDGRRAAITGPRGGLMLIFDLAQRRGRGGRGARHLRGRRAREGLRLLDRRGAVPALDGGPAREERVPGLAFDNHLVRNLTRELPATRRGASPGRAAPPARRRSPGRSGRPAAGRSPAMTRLGTAAAASRSSEASRCACTARVSKSNGRMISVAGSSFSVSTKTISSAGQQAALQDRQVHPAEQAGRAAAERARHGVDPRADRGEAGVEGVERHRHEACHVGEDEQADRAGEEEPGRHAEARARPGVDQVVEMGEGDEQPDRDHPARHRVAEAGAEQQRPRRPARACSRARKPTTTAPATVTSAAAPASVSELPTKRR